MRRFDGRYDLWQRPKSRRPALDRELVPAKPRRGGGVQKSSSASLFLQFLLNNFLNQARVGSSTGFLHYLSDEKTFHTRLTRLELHNRLAICSQHLFDG